LLVDSKKLRFVAGWPIDRRSWQLVPRLTEQNRATISEGRWLLENPIPQQ